MGDAAGASAPVARKVLKAKRVYLTFARPLADILPIFAKCEGPLVDH